MGGWRLGGKRSDEGSPEPRASGHTAAGRPSASNLTPLCFLSGYRGTCCRRESGGKRPGAMRLARGGGVPQGEVCATGSNENEKQLAAVAT